MLNYLFVLFLYPATFKNCQPISLDYWQVYLNKEKIQEFNKAGNQNIISLKLSSLKATDSLHIKYFTDTKCKRCTYHLQVATENSFSAFEGPSYEKIISLSINQLLKLRSDNNGRPLNMFLIENTWNKETNEILIFTSKFE